MDFWTKFVEKMKVAARAKASGKAAGPGPRTIERRNEDKRNERYIKDATVRNVNGFYFVVHFNLLWQCQCLERGEQAQVSNHESAEQCVQIDWTRIVIHGQKWQWED